MANKKKARRPIRTTKVRMLLQRNPAMAAKMLVRVYEEEHFTYERVAARIPCAPQTLQRWEKVYPELGEAVEKAREVYLKSLQLDRLNSKESSNE